ncbi:MAG: Hpt domain-containing protein [Pseudomonadota bacterium]
MLEPATVAPMFVDMERIKELARDFGKDDLVEILHSFIEETAEAVDALADTVSDEPNEARSGHFHFLKGCAYNIGATQLAKLCERGEQSSGSFSTAQQQEIKDAFESVKAFLLGDELAAQL